MIVFSWQIICDSHWVVCRTPSFQFIWIIFQPKYWSWNFLYIFYNNGTLLASKGGLCMDQMTSLLLNWMFLVHCGPRQTSAERLQEPLWIFSGQYCGFTTKKITFYYSGILGLDGLVIIFWNYMRVFGENAGSQLQSRFQWLQPQVSTFSFKN